MIFFIEIFRRIPEWIPEEIFECIYEGFTKEIFGEMPRKSEKRIQIFIVISKGTFQAIPAKIPYGKNSLMIFMKQSFKEFIEKFLKKFR